MTSTSAPYETHTGARRCGSPKRSRKGVAALIALVCLSLATIVGTLLLKAGLTEQRYLDRLAMQAQGEWLVEAGLSRARAQLTKASRYSGETWSIPGSAIGREQNATVRISVQTNPSSTSRWHVEAVATFAASNEPAIQGSCEVEAR